MFNAFRILLSVIGLACIWAAPSAAQTQPDFTGVWTTYRTGNGPGGGARGAAEGPSLTPEAQAKVDTYQSAIAGTNHSPGAYCVGTGMPGSMLGSGGYPMEIMQRPEQINIVYEAHKETRRIYFGDRAGDADSVWPDRNGFSVGRWEGDTLVIETDHLMEQVDQRYPHSEHARIVERYRLGIEDGGKKVITATLTMTGPEFLSTPFTAEKKWQEVPNGRVFNYECSEPGWLDVLDRLMSGETVEWPGE
jgi:hypothetical protein